MPKLAMRPIPVEQRVFAQNVKTARIAAGLRQQDLVASTGLSRPYLSDVERCVSSIGLENMALLSHAVQIPLFHLAAPQFDCLERDDTQQAWHSYLALMAHTAPVEFEIHVFARNLNTTREAQHYTKAKIEGLTGISSEFLLRVERGASSISLEHMVQLAQALAMPLHQLLKP